VNNNKMMQSREALGVNCSLCPYFLARQAVPKSRTQIHQELVVLINEFIRETYRLQGHSKTPAHPIYENFTSWWDAKNIGPPPTQTLFGRVLASILPKTKSNGRIVYFGLIPKTEPAAVPPR